MKKLLVAPLLVTVLLTPQQEMRADCSDINWGNIAAIGAGVFAVGAVGAAIKYACSPYSHEEEIERGQMVQHEARNCYDNYFHWRNNGIYYPLNSCYSDIKGALRTIGKKQRKIKKKVRHLEKRKADLYKERRLTPYEQENYRQQYDQLCCELNQEATKLQGLHTRLRGLRTIAKLNLLMQESKDCYDKYVKKYRPELDLLSGTTSYYMTNYQSSTFSRMICSWFNDLPFTSYYSMICKDIKTVDRQKTEARDNMRRSNRPVIDCWNYQQLCSDLRQEIQKLETLSRDLCNIRASIKTLPGYQSDKREKRRREEEEARRREERRREEARRKEERARQRERRRMQENLRELEQKINQLIYQRNNPPCDCTDCYIADLQSQIRDLQAERDRISVCFSW